MVKIVYFAIQRNDMKGMYLLSSLLLCVSIQAQKNQNQSNVGSLASEDSSWFKNIAFRLVGPFRGGRSAAVCGSYKDANTFFMGSTGGGVWKTTDAGNNWKNISDPYFGGSIGAVTLSHSNENIIYVGEGENTLRGNVSEGIHGMWKSIDGGRKWSNTGLSFARHITNILIHPENPDIVWVAVQGPLFGPSTERGVYKTMDGGKNWRRVLFSGHPQAGAVDLVMEPNNPNVLYASTWNVIRTPYSLESGGPGSALWKSSDGGETWQSLMNKKGMPLNETIGIIGITVSAAEPDRLYALIECQSKGLYTSKDAGNTWEKITDNADLCQRSWYFSKLFCDPKQSSIIYVLNVGLWRSRDGGKNWEEINTPHGDHHDLWIDPENPGRMIIADDGGAQVSFDAGNTWSTYENQPTAQFYRVSTDNAFPYHILGAQQDNTTVRIKCRSYGGAITEQDWMPTAGFESGFVVADPLNPSVVYGGNYQGYISRYDHQSDENRAVSVWPVESLGDGVIAAKYRFQWNFPLFFSPHNPKRLYAGGNKLFVTENEGQSWQAISPDLTTNDTSRQKSSGGPITKDNTGVEYYCTIFTAAESETEKDVLWTGSDDGLIHVSRNGGKTWENVTPKDAPNWMQWNCVETSSWKNGTAYFAGTRYKLNDFKPYVFKTTDYGKTWQLLISGIDNMHFTRVIRADKRTEGLLYCGTEYGLYISYDDGRNWRPFQLNLPKVPITDMTIKNNDLIIATQGRSFWILDDLTLIQQRSKKALTGSIQAWPPDTTYRMEGYESGYQGADGQNKPNAMIVHYWLDEKAVAENLKVEIRNSKNQIVKTFSRDAKEPNDKLSYQGGMNTLKWDLKYPATVNIDGLVMWNGSTISGLRVAPGLYNINFKLGNDSINVPAYIVQDRKYPASAEDIQQQVEFLITVKDKFNEIQQTIKNIRDLRQQISEFVEGLDSTQFRDILTLADSIKTKMTSIETALYQTKSRSPQDVLNYPIRINDQMASIYNYAASGYNKPAQQAIDAFRELSAKADEWIQSFKTLQTRELMTLNKLIHEASVPVIGIKNEK
jgi:photosystem II stability/assembly factor-like uncharacterized protein